MLEPELCPQNMAFLWTKRLKTALCPQNTPFLWMNRSKSELSPQNRAFSWSNLPNTALSSSKHPLFVDESAVSLPVGRLQSVQSAFLGAIRDENWCFTPECLSSSTFPGLKFQFSSRTALFKPLGPARALGKTLICNHLIINIVVKSHLPGEAKLVSPGKP